MSDRTDLTFSKSCSLHLIPWHVGVERRCSTPTRLLDSVDEFDDIPNCPRMVFNACCHRRGFARIGLTVAWVCQVQHRECRYVRESRGVEDPHF